MAYITCKQTQSAPRSRKKKEEPAITLYTDEPAAFSKLRAGERVELTGYVYTARDAAHKRMFACLEKGEPLGFDPYALPVYYAGPTQTPPHLPIGSCGPTTSGRMDVYAPAMLDAGLRCMIGKGERSQAVYDALARNGAVYLCALGGAGALAAACVKSCEVIAFADLGCESVKLLRVERFPLIVAADCTGAEVFSAGRRQWAGKA